MKPGSNPPVALRTRPLCAYPLTAHWTGKGSTDDAGNFVCK
jgi:feruloyl esterase